MTDKEMAEGLGRYIIRTQRRMRAMESFLTEYFLATNQGAGAFPCAEKVDQIEQDESTRRVSASQLNVLLPAIAAENQGSDLIRVLHSQFL